jgi:hypothetical protein
MLSEFQSICIAIYIVIFPCLLTGDSDLAPALQEAESILGRGRAFVVGGKGSLAGELKK